MGKSKGKKIRILYVADILRKYSDEEHPLTSADIILHLEEMGVTTERKALYDDISVLCEYGMDIIKTRVPTPGYYLADRGFELPEIFLLSDAVQAAGFVSPKKTRLILSHLEDMMSDSQVKEMRSRVYIDNRNKCENEEIYYSIDVITRAISEHKKIEFIYSNRALDDNGKIFANEKAMKVSPYALTWSGDHYYLVGNNDHYDNLMHMRIDRMKKVKISKEAIRHFSEVSEYKNSFDIADYTQKSFNMFGGEETDIVLECDKRYLEQMLDRFNKSIQIRNISADGFTFKTRAIVSDGLVDWIMQFGGALKVISPKKLREMVKEKADKIAKLYD